MIKKLFSIRNGLWIFLFIMAAISILSLTTFVIAESSRNKKIKEDRDTISDSFEAILEGLEFYGLADSTLEKIQIYRELVGENSNLIITDDAGRIVYNANNGFMPDSEHFIVLTNPESNYPLLAYILDQELEVRYKIVLNKTYNGMKLAEHINEYKNKTDLYADIRKQETLSMGIADTDDKNMHYAYIGSKGWNVYSIQKDIPYYNCYPNDWLEITNSIGIIAFVLFWLVLPIWVFLDAKRRNYKPALWGILLLVTNIIGLIIYILTRPENPSCQGCGEFLDTGYVYCPYCGAENKEVCHSCKTVLEKNWLFCPHCGQKINNKRPILLADEEENNLLPSDN